MVSKAEKRPWFEMSTTNTDSNHKSKHINYIHSRQQTQISSTSVLLTKNSNIRNDLPPETVYKNELNRKKRFENHLAILKSHKTHNSFPTALSAMPHPTIGSDSEEFVKEWNDILNQYRHKLMDITTQYLNDTLDETKGKLDSVIPFIDQNKHLEIEPLVDKQLDKFIEKS
ncbi:unnamed protein product [Didymodactylos carnosus]|uniref:Uncharacterized protein n=1 Tax=Didymodactylos carnosus TaxID=1234261 RepID=A0A8S2EQF6_9BILA|nr:unnamed protein product [Didymodactylos carnosus]CAF4082017.1 unnamed protein product [Didymodactylos carnosus]